MLSTFERIPSLPNSINTTHEPNGSVAVVMAVRERALTGIGRRSNLDLCVGGGSRGVSGQVVEMEPAQQDSMDIKFRLTRELKDLVTIVVVVEEGGLQPSHCEYTLIQGEEGCRRQ